MTATRRAIPKLMAATGIALCSATPAEVPAGMVNFACAQAVSHYKLYLSVDLSAKTAAAWFKPATQMEVHKVPATITVSLVAWTLHARPGASSFTLDRDSGALTVLHPDREIEKWNCEKTAEPL